MAHDSPPLHSFARRRLPWLVAAALSGAPAAYPVEAPAPRHIGLPITFERNDGQFPPDVLFVSRGESGTLQLRSGELAIVPRGAPLATDAPRLRFRGANPVPEVEPAQPLVTRSHYYFGNDPRAYVTGVPHFGELQLKDVYPGIDVALHGRDGALEYDFVVSPSGDPDDIRIDLRGAEMAVLDADGNLHVETTGHHLVQRAPIAYQRTNGEQRAVAARFVVVEGPDGPEARLALGDYDRAAPLTIDPVIAYSTYVGSSGADIAPAMKVGASGDIYFTQLENGSDLSVNGIGVTHLDPSTNTVLYQTHFGGQGRSGANAIALGGSGTNVIAFVAGYTSAADFPAVIPKSGASFDAFVAAIGPSGTMTARLLGGSGDESAYAIATDHFGNAYVGGWTESRDFPNPCAVCGPFANGPGSSDGFLVKVGADTNIAWVMAIGGSATDAVTGLAFDHFSGDVLAVGQTYSSDFPQVNAGAPLTSAPSAGGSRAFLARIATPGGPGIRHMGWVGGAAPSARAVAADPVTGDAIVVGTITGPGLAPTTLGASGGATDGFVLRVNPTGTPYYGAYIGGSGGDGLIDVLATPGGDIYVAGYTASANQVFVDPLQAYTGGQEALVARLRNGTFDFASSLGSSGTFAWAVGSRGLENEVYVGGLANGTVPIVAPFRATRQGPSDQFLTRIGGLAPRIPARLRVKYDGNGDGRSDLVWRNASGGQGEWFMNGPSAVGYAGLDAGSGYLAQFVADFNGDGRSDVVYRHPDGSWKMQLLNGSSVLAESTLLGASGAWSIVGTGDFNGDGKADLLFRASDGTPAVWLMNGISLAGAGTIGASGTGFGVALVADFDGDGRSDLVMTHPDGRAEMWIMNGTSVVSKQPLIGAGLGWHPIQAPDLNGDGKADLIWAHDDGRVGMWLMNGTGITGYGNILTERTGWSVVLTADLDGDGRQDVLLRHVDGRHAAWLMDGATIRAAAVLLGPASGWTLVSAGDFNGDRKADLVWRNVDGSHGVWLMNGLSIAGYGSLLGPSTSWELAP